MDRRPPGALLFDAFGTLFDVASVESACEALHPGGGGALSRLWRQKQLEHSWLHALMGTYRPFDAVTAEALACACAALGVSAEPGRLQALAACYQRLDPFADTAPALGALQGVRLAILSNGTPRTLGALLDHTGLANRFEMVLSADAVRTYKPDPRVYRLASDRLGLPPERLWLVSSNGWDVAGAAAAGLGTCWVNRGGAPLDCPGQAPGAVVTNLLELPPLVR